MEKNHFVFIFPIVVVPIQASRCFSACKLHCAHRDCTRKVDFTRTYNTSIVEFGNKHARTYSQNRFHFVPTTERNRIQVVFGNIFVDNNGNFRKHNFVCLGYFCKVRIVFQAFDFCKDSRIVILLFLHLKDEFGKVETFHVDTVSLQGYFVKTHRLESRRSCADTAQIEAFHTLYHTANCRKIIEILSKRFA